MRADLILQWFKLLWCFHFYWRNLNNVWGVGDYCQCKKTQIKLYYAKSTYGTDSAPLKYTLKQFHYSRSIWSLRDLTDIKVAQIALKYKKTPHFTNTNTGLLIRVPL